MECDYLNGWIKNGHIHTQISPKMVNPRDIAGEQKEEERPVGNEIADQLAKEGREKEQPPSHLSYTEVKTLIRNKKKAI